MFPISWPIEKKNAVIKVCSEGGLGTIDFNKGFKLTWMRRVLHDTLPITTFSLQKKNQCEIILKMGRFIHSNQTQIKGRGYRMLE